MARFVRPRWSRSPRYTLFDHGVFTAVAMAMIYVFLGETPETTVNSTELTNTPLVALGIAQSAAQAQTIWGVLITLIGLGCAGLSYVPSKCQLGFKILFAATATWGVGSLASFLFLGATDRALIFTLIFCFIASNVARNFPADGECEAEAQGWCS